MLQDLVADCTLYWYYKYSSLCINTFTNKTEALFLWLLEVRRGQQLSPVSSASGVKGQHTHKKKKRVWVWELERTRDSVCVCMCVCVYIRRIDGGETDRSCCEHGAAEVSCSSWRMFFIDYWSLHWSFFFVNMSIWVLLCEPGCTDPGYLLFSRQDFLIQLWGVHVTEEELLITAALTLIVTKRPEMIFKRVKCEQHDSLFVFIVMVIYSVTVMNSDVRGESSCLTELIISFQQFVDQSVWGEFRWGSDQSETLC